MYMPTCIGSVMLKVYSVGKHTFLLDLYNMSDTIYAYIPTMLRAITCCGWPFQHHSLANQLHHFIILVVNYHGFCTFHGSEHLDRGDERRVWHGKTCNHMQLHGNDQGSHDNNGFIETKK